jgi:hypothetical protein
MADPTVQQLFRKWRQGDAECGQEMAQKFSDWYYAITTIRVADRSGRQPLERACQAFAQGIVGVTRPSGLVDWAHDILERELQTIGRGLDDVDTTGGDHPNALTKNQSPTALVQTAAVELEPAQIRLLAMAYDTDVTLAAVETVGDGMGGLPFALLDARYALKRALQHHADIGFSVLPEESNMDRAPISLYEAGRLLSSKERRELEKWLLTDIDLCKDVAEFATFVHALRAGALTNLAVSPAPAAPEPRAQTTTAAPEEAPADTWAEQPDPFGASHQDEIWEEADSDDAIGHNLDDFDEAATAPAPPESQEPAPAKPAIEQKSGGLSTIIWTGVIVFVGLLTLLGLAVLILRWD